MTSSSKPSAAPVRADAYNLRYLYLSSLGLIQLIAYWSYYVQFPGLLSASGIEPVNRVFSLAAPSLHQRFLLPKVIDEDSLCEILALLGMLISALIASGICQHGFLFGANVAIYGLLVRTGGTFYSFQWDVLLLETTFITCVTYAPWTTLTASNNRGHAASPYPPRFLLFKLMYMSGIVKLQAQCPTWEKLTALEFHFATQCLPGPLAWYAHQLSPFLLRLGVAATLWIEIPATILLVVPFTTMRRIGASLQVLLQIMIILTGNYNFFNLLTMALCIPVWESSSGNTKRRQADIKILSRFWEHAISWGFLLWTWTSMFRIEHAKEDGNLNISLDLDSPWLQPQVFIPLVPYLTLLAVAWVMCTTQPKSILSKVFHGSVCLWVIAVVALPLSQLHSRKHFLRPMLTRFHQTYTQPYGLVNGYGLFRRMTGVGTAQQRSGWAGLPPSVVARPEIILEGSQKDHNWQELDFLFRWKPGAVDQLPKQMAPHQPRLDWQMWFAALGNINHNAWLIHLISKLLTGCAPVLDLVGAPPDFQAQQIRAKLYHYDFTRLNTTWSQTIPGVEMVPLEYPPSKVWSRQLANDYLPPVAAADLKEYLQKRRYKSFCVDPKSPCAHLPSSLWCPLMTAIRRLMRLHLLIPLALLLWWTRQGLSWLGGKGSKQQQQQQTKQRKHHEEKKTQ